MHIFSKNLFLHTKAHLNEVELKSENDLQLAQHSYAVLETALRKLKTFIRSNNYIFKDEEEEIWYNKIVQPKFLRRLIYFKELYYIQANKPVSSNKAQKAYYKLLLDTIGTYFDRHKNLFNYYKSGSNIHDKVYFLNRSQSISFEPIYVHEVDSPFTSSYSFKLAKLQALEKLRQYLHSHLEKYNQEHQSVIEANPYLPLDWTENKVALIELAYAIHARGAVKAGKADIKDIIKGFELLFNVSLGNFYRSFQDIIIRKKNPTLYLDILKDSLNRYIDDRI